MGVRAGDCLKFDGTTRFAPLHTEAEFWWEEPHSHRIRACRFKETAYYIPVGPGESLSVAYYFWSFLGVRRWLSRLLRPFVALGVRHEIALDKWLIENVVPESLGAAGRRLGRFDTGLHELRKRWQRWREDYAPPGRSGADPQENAPPASYSGGAPC
jgi:hypothetical protein